MSRGRPAGQMTHRRRQVLAELMDAMSQGERVNLSRIARACGLYSNSDVRRIVNDLKRLNRI